MKYKTFSAFFFAMMSTTLSLDLKKERLIDTVIQKTFIPYHQITGLGLAIVQGNETMVKGYGHKNLENGLSADGDTMFAIGSISKSFTATLVVKTLSERFPDLGESALDVPIRTLCPAFNFTLRDRFRSESTSFRDLLSHKLCLQTDFYGLTVGIYKTKQEFVFRQRYADEVCPFRTNFVYSAALTIAGEIAAAIANSTFEDMLDSLFKQIEMTDTIVVKESDDYDNMTNMSRGYYRQNGETKSFNAELLKRVSVAIGSGGILSTPNDIAKYMMFHLNNGKVGSQQIISEEVIKYIRRISNPFPFESGKKRPSDIVDFDIAYGLGLNIGIYDGWERLTHGGYLPPFESSISLYPALNLGIFTVSNGPGSLINQTVAHSYLHRQIFEILDKGENYNSYANASYTTPSANSTSSFPMPKANPSSSSKSKKPVSRVEPRDVIGLYGNGLSGEFTLSIPNNTLDGDLYIKYGTWGAGTLSRRSNTSFVVNFDSDIVQEFYASETPDMKVVVDFREENVAILLCNTVFGEERSVYQKDLTLDKLPLQPWDSDSCGPKASGMLSDL